MKFNKLFIETILFDHKTPLTILISSLLQSSTSQSAIPSLLHSATILLESAIDVTKVRQDRHFDYCA